MRIDGGRLVADTVFHNGRVITLDAASTIAEAVAISGDRVIAVGSDADIVVLDTSKRRTVRAQDLHETDYTPWEGKEVGAWPSVTVLRGKVMVADGKFYGDLKDGQYLKRKIPDAIRARHNKDS